MNNKSKPGFRTQDIFRLIQYSFGSGIGIMLFNFLIGALFFKNATYVSPLIPLILGIVITIPLWSKYIAADSTCPSCKKSFKMSDTDIDIISESQKIEKRNRTINNINQKIDVLYDIKEYWQYSVCDHCGFETKRRETSKKEVS